MNLRPLALPVEHGGWGFLFEPLLLGMLVAPGWSGLALCVAALLGFLARQPLKLALQDALKRKTYPRTVWCRRFAVGYASGALVAASIAVALSGPRLLLPFAIVAPLAILNIVYDARNRSRNLLPELTGPAAMASSAAAIALADGRSFVVAAVLASLAIARGIPTVLYVRALIARAHKQTPHVSGALLTHVAAIAVGVLLARAGFAPHLAIAIFSALLVRCIWGLARPVPRAQTIGWTEIVWGVVTVVTIGMVF